MILGQISYLDCIVFVFFLIPQLLLHVPFQELLLCGAQVLPFLVFRMPYQLIVERYFTKYPTRSPFCQHATVFQDIVIRCVRYAFANFPSHIGRVFFSAPVALPFTHFRMLRHGQLTSPYPWREVRGESDSFRGLYVTSPASASNASSDQPPDLILYYLHGGGFSMGSSYFYLEFLLALCALLRERCLFMNPAVLGLEYDLVPDRRFPVQATQARAGLEWCVEHVAGQDAGRVVVAGDSAGATLALGLLVGLATEGKERGGGLMPGFATLLSPWCVLVSEKNQDTPSDYLNAETLHHYARQYAGAETEEDHTERSIPSPSSTTANGNAKEQQIQTHTSATPTASSYGHLLNPIASPGLLNSSSAWRRATPKHGFHFVYGSEEVFAPDARDVVTRIRAAWAETPAIGKGGSAATSGKADWASTGGTEKGSALGEEVVLVTEEEAGIHAWPVVNLFLGESKEGRMRGVETIVDIIAQRIRRGKVWR